jgi:hypothetical protein
MELGAMWYFYKEMQRKNFVGADRYYHCMAHCTATTLGPNGVLVSLVVGLAREAIDFPWNMVKKQKKTGQRMTLPQSWSDCRNDRHANELGRNTPPNRSCDQQCRPLAPPGFAP